MHQKNMHNNNNNMHNMHNMYIHVEVPDRRLGPGLGETLSDVFEKREFYSAPRASRWSPASPANPQAQVSSRTSRWSPGMTDITSRKRSNTAICITPRPAVHGEVGERSFLHFSWLLPPPLAATGGQARW